MSENGKCGDATYQIDPGTANVGDYLDAIEGGETALHVYMTDDKEWWLAHDPDGEYPGDLNGPWLFWSTYPSGSWDLRPCSRTIIQHHVDELYYVDYNGDEAHSVHEATVVELEDAPEFVRNYMEAVDA